MNALQNSHSHCLHALADQYPAGIFESAATTLGVGGNPYANLGNFINFC